MGHSPAVQSRRKREREKRRCDILDAAERVFLGCGFATATMDEVAAAAEVSKGTLYLYFKSKDELYLAIVLRVMSGLVERYEELVADDSMSGRETLRALGRAYVDHAQAHRDHFRLGMSWLSSGYVVDPDTRNYDTYRGLVQRLFGATIATIERGKADGSVRDDIDPQTLAVQLWGGTFVVLLVNLNRDEVLRRMPITLDFDTLIPSFIDLVIDSIKPRTAQ